MGRVLHREDVSRESSYAGVGDAFVQGVGESIGHHGEIVQGVFLNGLTNWCRGLITLPCVELKSVVRVKLKYAGAFDTTCADPDTRQKAVCAVERTLEHFRVRCELTELDVQSNIPEGIGCGSSTADVVAAIRATASAIGRTLSARDVARIAVRAELASDPTPFGLQTVLFAQREGRVIEDFGALLPPLLVIGVNMAPDSQFDTVLMPPCEYSPAHRAAFQRLRDLFRLAVSRRDPCLLGVVATESAWINQEFYPKPGLERLATLSMDAGACGLQVAHSGTVSGVILDALQPDCLDIARAIEVALAHSGFVLTRTFHIGSVGGQP
ncbi:MAG: hypothetical protein RLO21_05605 [Nitratireductor sp.]